MSTKETDHPKECGIEQRLKVFMESIDITSSGKIMTELNLDTPLDKLKEIALECGLKMATIVTKEVSGPLVWLANQSTNERKENIPKNSESQTPKRQLSPNINRSSKRKRLDSPFKSPLLNSPDSVRCTSKMLGCQKKKSPKMSREAIEREIRNLEEKIEEMKELEEIKDGEIVEEEPDLAPAIEKWLEACQQAIQVLQKHAKDRINRDISVVEILAQTCIHPTEIGYNVESDEFHVL